MKKFMAAFMALAMVANMGLAPAFAAGHSNDETRTVTYKIPACSSGEYYFWDKATGERSNTATVTFWYSENHKLWPDDGKNKTFPDTYKTGVDGVPQPALWHVGEDCDSKRVSNLSATEDPFPQDWDSQFPDLSLLDYTKGDLVLYAHMPDECHKETRTVTFKIADEDIGTYEVIDPATGERTTEVTRTLVKSANGTWKDEGYIKSFPATFVKGGKNTPQPASWRIGNECYSTKVSYLDEKQNPKAAWLKEFPQRELLNYTNNENMVLYSHSETACLAETTRTVTYIVAPCAKDHYEIGGKHESQMTQTFTMDENGNWPGNGRVNSFPATVIADGNNKPQPSMWRSGDTCDSAQLSALSTTGNPSSVAWDSKNPNSKLLYFTDGDITLYVHDDVYPCEHGNDPATCEICHPAPELIKCTHGNDPETCETCHPAVPEPIKCTHGNDPATCEACHPVVPEPIKCEHGNDPATCEACHPVVPEPIKCEHGNDPATCENCHPVAPEPIKCEHGNDPATCEACHPVAPEPIKCTHGNDPATCEICHPTTPTEPSVPTAPSGPSIEDRCQHGSNPSSCSLCNPAEEDIADPEIPLAPGGIEDDVTAPGEEPEEEIKDNETPLSPPTAQIPQDEVNTSEEIIDAEVPLAQPEVAVEVEKTQVSEATQQELPKTGGVSALAVLTLGIAAIAGGVATKRKEN